MRKNRRDFYCVTPGDGHASGRRRLARNGSRGFTNGTASTSDLIRVQTPGKTVNVLTRGSCAGKPLALHLHYRPRGAWSAALLQEGSVFSRCFLNLRPLLLIAAATALSPGGLAVTFTSIDFPGAKASIANGINAQGDIVGEYTDATGNSHGFLLHSNIYSSIDFPGASFTSAKGINLAGDIVGWYQGGTADFHGFLLRAGVFTTVNSPTGTPAVANGINTAGDIVGSYSDSAGSHGFLLSGGVYTTIDYPASYCCSSGVKNSQAMSINRLGDIVGEYLPLLNSFGYLFQAGVFTSISSSSDQNIAYGINAQGDIAGTVFDAIGQHNHGFRMSGGVLTLMDFPGAALGTVVHGINDQGDIVGGYGCYATCMAHGFVALASGEAPPVIAPQVTGTVGNNGWYVSNVTVNWSVTDPSGIASSSGCAATSDTAGRPQFLPAAGQKGRGVSSRLQDPIFYSYGWRDTHPCNGRRKFCPAG